MSLQTYEHPLHDLEPPMRLELRQPATVNQAGARREPDGTWTKPIDLTTAISVTAVLTELRAGAQFTRVTVPHDLVNGQVDVIWQAGDPVDTAAADHQVQARILWSGNRPQTVPSRREDAFTLVVFEPRP